MLEGFVVYSSIHQKVIGQPSQLHCHPSAGKCLMAISVTLFRASNIYGGADIVNDQQFNESRLRHMEQATSVKSLID